MFSPNNRSWYLIPAELIRALDSSIPSRLSLLYLPQAVVSDYTLPSRVDNARLYLPSRSGCSSGFDARSIIPMLDPWFLSLKQNLGTVSVFVSPAESSPADRGFQNHYRFPQQQVFSVVLSPVRISAFHHC